MSDPSLPDRLYRAASVRELDRIAIEELNIPGATLMARAGQAAFELLLRNWPRTKIIAVVCGAGNNAGDGYVVARLAKEQGLEVRVADVGEPRRLRGDARAARLELEAAGVRPAPYSPASMDGAEVIVDAVFGTGLDRQVEGRWGSAIAGMNAASAPILALDIPSGLNADTGRVMGQAVRAAATVSFVGLKQGLFTGDGPEQCGRIHFHDLAVPESIFLRRPPDARLDRLEQFHAVLGARPRGAHKGRFGHLLVIGGDSGYLGATRLAAEAALRSGAGLVSVASRADHAHAINAGRPEIMAHGVETTSDLEALIRRASVIAVGPGLGQSSWAKRMLDSALVCEKPLVVDADGLNLLAGKKGARLSSSSVITPHPGEAGRLLSSSAAAVEADRFAALSCLVERFGCPCVLKGAGTLTAAPEGELHVCADGNPGMATGGMGDVLTGVVAALMAQGMKAETAARAGVCLHALAGDLAAGRLERGMLASDLMPLLRVLVNGL
ncbi:MAG TPA: NAD(P)H-hydrate dehydratase [Gammaproteobacteria bacterium]|nr:NAD(P)H-hydrate dehydratase [Gammaproteobacteria bacterium]